MTAIPRVDLSKLSIRPIEGLATLENFRCGEPEVDRNIPKCNEWHEQYRRRVYCAFLEKFEEPVGFYCIGISAADSKYLDERITRMSDYGSFVPFVYIHYLGVHVEYHRNKIGTMLLMHALERSAFVVKYIGICGVALNALNDHAAGLYEKYGFRKYGDRNKYPFMILPALSLVELIPCQVVS